jgi:hypothetical protein
VAGPVGQRSRRYCKGGKIRWQTGGSTIPPMRCVRQQNLETETRRRSGLVDVRHREGERSRLAGPTTVDRIRNGNLDQWEVAVEPASGTCRTPLAFLVEPEATWEVVHMDTRMLDGWFHYPGQHHNSLIWDIRPSENQMGFWVKARSAQIGT